MTELKPEDVVAKPERVRKICILGFADSRVQAPFDDPTWEIWGVNDVYAHASRVDVTFEVHHLLNLGQRRNPQHEQFLKEGKHPVWMTQTHEQYPSARAVPYEHLISRFSRAYFTNSISIMLAMAILEIRGDAPWTEEKWDRGEISLYGVDMAAGGPSNEYAAQRPSCEYFIGIADGLGIAVHVPENSDLCKATVVYGLGTTAPLRIKVQSRKEHLRGAKIQILQQQAQKQSELQMLQSQLDGVRGQMAALEYIEAVWTMPTDIPVGAILPEKDRSLGNGKVEDKVLELIGGAPSQI